MGRTIVLDRGTSYPESAVYLFFTYLLGGVHSGVHVVINECSALDRGPLRYPWRYEAGGVFHEAPFIILVGAVF